MKPTKAALAAIAAAVALAACETPPTKTQTGTAAGAVIGGVVGSTIGSGTGRTTAIVLGTIAGGVIGHKIGQKMDEADRIKAAQALENTKTGERSQWRNPDSGNRYTLVPTRTYEVNGQPCRDYTVNAEIDGRPEQVKGSACRDADGAWKATG